MAESKKMWVYLMHLSSNMWADPGATFSVAPYFDHMITSEDVWDSIIEFLPSQGVNTVLIDIGDGIQYESHPEINIPGAWSKDKMRKKLARIRELGMTPIPKLNFSACHDAWMKEYERMVSTSIYYQVCKDLIEEVWDLFDHPAYFHLGLDEETAMHQEHQRFVVIRQGDLWWHDTLYLIDVCEKLNMRPWVWADYCWFHQDEYLKNMPKTVLQSNWFYGEFHKKADGTYEEIDANAYRVLAEAGYDQIPTSSTWETWINTWQTFEMASKEIHTGLQGMMIAPWNKTMERHRYGLMDGAHLFKDAKDEFFPGE